MRDLRTSAFKPNARVWNSIETKSSTGESLASPKIGQLFSTHELDRVSSDSEDPLNAIWKINRGRQWVQKDTCLEEARRAPRINLPRTISPPQCDKPSARLLSGLKSRRMIRQIPAGDFIEMSQAAPSRRQCKLFKEVPRKVERKPLKAVRH